MTAHECPELSAQLAVWEPLSAAWLVKVLPKQLFTPYTKPGTGIPESSTFPFPFCLPQSLLGLPLPLGGSVSIWKKLLYNKGRLSCHLRMSAQGRTYKAQDPDCLRHVETASSNYFSNKKHPHTSSKHPCEAPPDPMRTPPVYSDLTKIHQGIHYSYHSSFLCPDSILQGVLAHSLSAFLFKLGVIVGCIWTRLLQLPPWRLSMRTWLPGIAWPQVILSVSSFKTFCSQIGNRQRTLNCCLQRGTWSFKPRCLVTSPHFLPPYQVKDALSFPRLLCEDICPLPSWICVDFCSQCETHTSFEFGFKATVVGNEAQRPGMNSFLETEPSFQSCHSHDWQDPSLCLLPWRNPLA